MTGSKVVKWRWRDTGEEFTVVLEPHEHAWYKAQYERVKGMEPCALRTQILNETAAFMEMHAAFPGSRMATASEAAADVREGPMTDAMASVHSLEERGFKIPGVVKEQMALGQLRMGDPGAVALEPVPDDSSLSDPDAATLGKFHRDGEDTERLAAIDVYPRTGTQRRKVLDAIAAAGERGMTDRELQETLGVRRARTRRQELDEGGWVENSGRTRKLDTGNDAIVWVLTERGRASYRKEAAGA